MRTLVGARCLSSLLPALEWPGWPSPFLTAHDPEVIGLASFCNCFDVFVFVVFWNHSASSSLSLPYLDGQVQKKELEYFKTCKFSTAQTNKHSSFLLLVFLFCLLFRSLLWTMYQFACSHVVDHVVLLTRLRGWPCTAQCFPDVQWASSSIGLVAMNCHHHRMQS